MNPEAKHNFIQGVASLPSWAAILTWLLGVPIEKWAALGGLVFILVQTAYLLWKWRRDHKREAERIARNEAPPTTDKAAL